MSRFFFVLMILCATLTSRGSAAGTTLLQSFTIHEDYGVSHPTQIVDFDLTAPVNPTNAYLIGPGNVEVPFQVLSGHRIALETNLPANTRRTWNLYAGKAPSFSSAGNIQVHDAGQWYEITNGLTGVRVIKTTGLINPLAAIQGILLRDGTWTATGPNYLYLGNNPKNNFAAVTNVAVKFIDRGPLLTVIQVSYSLLRSPAHYGNQFIDSGGTGYYTSTLQVEKDQPSILITEHANQDLRYDLSIYHGLEPNQVRYRSHHALDLFWGRRADGSPYTYNDNKPNQDAFYDIDHSIAIPAGNSSVHQPQGTMRQYMQSWDPWHTNSGVNYEMYYNKTGAGPNSNLIGIFPGKPSLAIGVHGSGWGLSTFPGPDAKISLLLYRRSADAKIFSEIRMQWGIYTATKGDMADPLQIQPIAHQQTLLGGINLSQIHRWKPWNPKAYRALYVPDSALQSTIERTQSDRSFHDYLFSASPYARNLITQWKDNSAESRQKAVDDIMKTAHDFLDALVNGDGTYDPNFHYWHGGLAANSRGIWIDQIRANAASMPRQIAQVESAAALFANILWNNDFVPMNWTRTGLNMGQTNMTMAEQGYRNFYAVMLSDDPDMTPHARNVPDQVQREVATIINEYGAAIGSTHYLQASLTPTLNTIQQLKTQLGNRDVFKRKDQRLQKFTDFYLNLMSPPDPRFGGLRKWMNFGDSPRDGDFGLTGQLATAFKGINDDLSAKAMWAFHAGGNKLSDFFGTNMVKIDFRLSSTDPRLGNANFPGYYTMLRHGWNTPNEAGIWMIDGDFYADHRHNDFSDIAVQALGSPIIYDLDANIYYPQLSGFNYKSLMIPESILAKADGQTWSTGNLPMQTASRMPVSNEPLKQFGSFTQSAFAKAFFDYPDGTTQARTIYDLHPDPDHPILAIQDESSGSLESASKILNFWFAADGAVNTPGGLVTPPVNDYSIHPQGASLGEVSGLKAGLWKFDFTGQQWGHVSSGINFSVVGLSDAPNQYVLGGFEHHAPPAGDTGSDFKTATGVPFFEKEILLRFRTPGKSSDPNHLGDNFILILPYRNSENRSGWSMTQTGNSIRISSGNEQFTVNPSNYTYQNGKTVILTTFDSNQLSFNGMNIQGGPAEVVWDEAKNVVRMTVSGSAGLRTFTLPSGHWTIRAPLTAGPGATLQWNYAGGAYSHASQTMTLTRE